MSPFLLEKCIASHTGSKPRTNRTKDATTFIIEVSSHSESIAMPVLYKITLLLRFIGCVFLTIPLRTSNFPGNVRHQLINLASLQIYKSLLLSVCLDIEMVVSDLLVSMGYANMFG